MNTWLTKICPTSLDNLFSRTKEISQITKWLCNFTNETQNILIIQGNHGIGKTCLIDLILKKNKFTRLNNKFIFGEYDKKKPIYLHLINMLNSTISQLIYDTSNKYCLVFDEIETMLNLNEKENLKNLLKYNVSKKTCPIICILNNQHNKIINEIKNKSLYIKLKEPDKTMLLNFIKHVSKIFSIDYETSNVIENIIDLAQNDYNSLINILYSLTNINSTNSKTIKIETINDYKNTYFLKNTNYDIYTSLNNLFKNHNIYKSYDIYFYDKINIPLYIQEHCYNYCINKPFVAKNILKGDIIENIMYSKQFWELTNIHALYSTVIPIEYTEIKTLQAYFTFPRDFNKTSTKKINIKNIKNVYGYFNMNNTDYIYASALIKNLINNNKIDNCYSLLKNLKLNNYLFESFLKIDKLYFPDYKNKKIKKFSFV